MAIRTGGMRTFDATDSDEVLRRLFHPDIIMRSFQSTIVDRWRRHIRQELFHIYFFDDLQSDPMALRRSIINFLGADPEKSIGRINVVRKINETAEKLPLTDGVRDAVAQFFFAGIENLRRQIWRASEEMAGAIRFGVNRSFAT